MKYFIDIFYVAKDSFVIAFTRESSEILWKLAEFETVILHMQIWLVFPH